MTNNGNKNSGCFLQITLALIGLLSAIGVALISNWEKIFPKDGQPTASSSQSTDVSTSLASPPPSTVSSQPALSCQYEKIDPIHVEIKPDKAVYTQLEEIKVAFTVDGAPDNYKQWITVVEASRPEKEWSSSWQWVSKNGSISFKPQLPGDYQIRLFLNTGSEDVPVGYCSITVNSVSAQ